MRRHFALLALAQASALLWQAPALADSDGIKLGQIPKYPTEAQAKAACGDDPVVWADSYSGFFYPKFHPDYGRTPHGAYTCYSRAKTADYWNLVPEGGEREGRQFPEFFCYTCS